MMCNGPMEVAANCLGIWRAACLVIPLCCWRHAARMNSPIMRRCAHCSRICSANGIEEETILDLLDEALSSGVLMEEGTGTRIAYRFWHPLLASHLYNNLSAMRRARLHRRAAEVLQQVYSAREDGQAAAITEHLVKGGGEAGQIVHF